MLKTIDLFAGAGGLSLGFQLAGGFKIVAAAEINKYARETYKANIAKNNPDFVFIENVLGYDFAALNERLGGIDIVIGGPPCQGFSNANRQKNHIISMNNGLVKEYFRAIKEIRPRAFVMENVSMLRSDTHRFYESASDKEQIDALIEAGFQIPTRDDTLLVSERAFEGIDYEDLDISVFQSARLPADLAQLIVVLNKNLNNPRRLPTYLKKHCSQIITKARAFIDLERESVTPALAAVFARLTSLSTALQNEAVNDASDDIKYIVALQKAVETIDEIKENRLLGRYEADGDALLYRVRSYSVIDYIKAILGGEYIQTGGTVNAEWFGVPQDRKRYIVMGIRSDVCSDKSFTVPKAPDRCIAVTVGEAILDLVKYDASFEPESSELAYVEEDASLSPYAIKMREGSSGVNNHITTKTTPTALDRFKAIKQGDNFHSLDVEMKSTYSKPDRTQKTIYLRLNPEEPSGTVVNVRKSMWIHPTLDRAITIREAARLQSFPDRFVFCGSKDSQYQQVGNAVPPFLAKAIAEHLLETIK
jgi:DNA (cytosine-5)-methyltransferase 1